MRLTLRTLLAYLDDQLSPGEAKEIGAKLQEAPAARALADRAKETLRRRRLGVPGDPAAGGEAGAGGADAVDPNEVAAYLDNALPPDRVAAVEQVCLADDAHLAEVAACHQILTRVLSEPATLRPAAAARLLALAPDADPEADAGPAGRMAAAPAPVTPRAAPATLGGTAAGEFDASLPEHLRRSSRRGWGWVPWAVALTLGGVWVASLLLDGDLFGPRVDPTDRIVALDPAAAGMAPDAGLDAGLDAAPGPDGDAGAGEDTGADPAAPVPGPDAGVDPAEAARLADSLPLDPPPPEEVPPPPADAGAETDAAAVAAASSGTPDGGEMTPGDSAVTPAAESPAGPAAPAVTVASGEGLFALDADRGGFFQVEPGGAVPPGTPLVVPGPLRAALEVDGVPLGLELAGGTRVALAAGPSPAAPLAVSTEAGRVRLVGTNRADGRAAAVLVAGGASWAVAPSAGATAGLAVSPRLPSGAEAAVRGNPVSAVLYAVGGPVTVTDLAPGASGEPVEVPAGSAAVMVTDGGALAAPAASAPEGGVPDWVAGPDRTRAETLLADAFAEALAPGQPLAVSLPPLADGPRALPAVQAVNTMALTRDAADLGRAIKRTPHPEVVLAAADGLRGLLGRSPELDAAVRDAISREFSLEAPLQLQRLLDRFSDAEARDPRASAELVGLLESDELAVRTLAIDELERLTGLTRGFRPLESPGSRNSAVRRWRDHLQRVGAVRDPDAAPTESPAGGGGEEKGGEGGPDGGDDADATGLNFGNLIPDDL